MENLGSLRPVPCNHKNWTGAALSDLPLERNPMQIAKRGFFNLGLIDALCQAHVKNTQGPIYMIHNSWNVLPIK